MKEVRNVKKPGYQAPEIVQVGSVSELTGGMGGDSKDMDGWTIPVQPRNEDADSKELDGLV